MKKSKNYKIIGDIPGNPIFIGKQNLNNTLIDYIEYNNELINEYSLETINTNYNNETDRVIWLNISGLHNPSEIANICNIFNIHSLNIEDILNTSHRAKIDLTDEYTLIIIKILNYNPDKVSLIPEQLSIIFNKNLLITIRENKTGFFEPIRDRLRSYKGKIREKNADYLLFAIIDLLFDHYNNIIELYGDKISDLENELIESPTDKTLLNIYNLKKDLNILKKYIKPTNDIIQNLSKNSVELFHKSNKPFIKDLNDMITHIIDKLDSYTNIINDFINLYHTNTNNKMNEIMKVLTIFSTIFIPLTFIAGVYGMNFDSIPELHLKYGYLFFWILTFLVFIVMIFYFRKKKWF